MVTIDISRNRVTTGVASLSGRWGDNTTMEEERREGFGDGKQGCSS